MILQLTLLLSAIAVGVMSNIALGIAKNIGIKNLNWDWKKFKLGLLKGGCISGSFYGLAYMFYILDKTGVVYEELQGYAPIGIAAAGVLLYVVIVGKQLYEIFKITNIPEIRDLYVQPIVEEELLDLSEME